MQQAYFKCAHECFDRRRSQDEISNCVENCSVPVVRSQQMVENETAKFQVSCFSFLWCNLLFILLLQLIPFVSEGFIPWAKFLAKKKFTNIQFKEALLIGCIVEYALNFHKPKTRKTLACLIRGQFSF